MAARPSLGPGSGVIPGPTFFAEYQPAMKGLFDASALPLTDIGGTGDVITASLHWDLDAGLLDGMKFTLTAAAANTGAVTLSINGGSAVPVLAADGSALIAGSLVADQRVLVEYVGGSFVVLSGSGSGSGSGSRRFYWAFTASGTWYKPDGLPDDAMVLVEMWGGGQSGGRTSVTGVSATVGGAGGGYRQGWWRASDLPASVAVGIGAGGAPRTTNGTGLAGGTTSFGALMTVTGGTNGVGGGRVDPSFNDQQGIWGGATPLSAEGIDAVRGRNAVFGGASGGGRYQAGSGVGAGGVSEFGGNGGNASNNGVAGAGVAPGGGGGAAGGNSPGNSGAGARGELRIWI